MAVVRFSDSLKSDIRYAAQRMFEKRIVKARELDLGMEEAELATMVCDNLFSAEEKQHMNAISYMLEKKKSVTLRNVNGECLQLSLNFASEVPWPVEDYDGVQVGGGIIGRYHVDVSGEQWKDLAERIHNRNEHVKKLQQDQCDFIETVMKLINRHTTLAPALREWKGLWELLPDETKERHKKKVERKKTVATQTELEEEGIDIGKLTSVVGLNRLTGGN